MTSLLHSPSPLQGTGPLHLVGPPRPVLHTPCRRLKDSLVGCVSVHHGGTSTSDVSFNCTSGVASEACLCSCGLGDGDSPGVYRHHFEPGRAQADLVRWAYPGAASLAAPSNRPDPQYLAGHVPQAAYVPSALYGGCPLARNVDRVLSRTLLVATATALCRLDC